MANPVPPQFNQAPIPLRDNNKALFPKGFVRVAQAAQASLVLQDKEAIEEGWERVQQKLKQTRLLSQQADDAFDEKLRKISLNHPPIPNSNKKRRTGF